MSKIQEISDKFAISLSLICAIHCIATPLVLLLVPSLASMQFDGEVFHRVMVTIVIPLSVITLFLGCKVHKRSKLMIYGAIGLSLMVAALLTESLLDMGFLEKPLTLIGAFFIAYAHYQNYKLCRLENCKCNS